MVISGAGLGLSICKKLTKLMGGGCGFTSKIGVGSTFYASVALRKTFSCAQDLSVLLVDLTRDDEGRDSGHDDNVDVAFRVLSCCSGCKISIARGVEVN